MTKNQIKKRIQDIAAGADLIWNDQHKYWDNYCFEAMGSLIGGIETVFDLPSKNRLRDPHRWKAFDHLATLTDLVIEAIEYDHDE